MLALVGLFTATMSTTLCMMPEILAMRTDAEMWCDGAIECFDGCDICGSKMCELHAEVATSTCECDFLMCYAYCAKQICEDPVTAAGGAQRCAGWMLARGEELAGCAVNCSAAWTLSPLSALVLMFVRWNSY